MNLKSKVKKPKKLEELDRLFLRRLNKIIRRATDSFEEYEYSRCKNEVVSFFWNDFTDNYLELVKYRVYNGAKKEKASAFYTLYISLLTILKMMAPITCFITEEIYQEHFKKNEKEKSIHLTSWPEEFRVSRKEDDEEVYNLLFEIIRKVRQEKSLHSKSVKVEIILSLEKKEQEKLKKVLRDLRNVINAKEIREGKFKVEFV